MLSSHTDRRLQAAKGSAQPLAVKLVNEDLGKQTHRCTAMGIAEPVRVLELVVSAVAR